MLCTQSPLFLAIILARKKSGYLSSIAVTPWPPAAHMEIRPRPRPFCSNNFANVAIILGPVAAKWMSSGNTGAFYVLILHDQYCPELDPSQVYFCRNSRLPRLSLYIEPELQRLHEARRKSKSCKLKPARFNMRGTA